MANHRPNYQAQPNFFGDLSIKLADGQKLLIHTNLGHIISIA